MNERRTLLQTAAEGAIHLYLTRYGAEVSDLLAERYRALLSDEEKIQERRFFFAEDQRRYLVTRALVRTVLSRYSEIDPRQWRFRSNRWGKPEIANPEAQQSEIRFNLSHTRGLIALAVTRSQTLGIDVENVAAREASLPIAEHYFASAETATIRNLQGAERQEGFFTFWTLKEAYIKARGLGLSIPLNHFCFHLPSASTVAFETSPELQDDADRWQFWLFRPAADCLLALCAERRAGWTISAQWTVPLGTDEVVQLQLLRSSR